VCSVRVSVFGVYCYMCVCVWCVCVVCIEICDVFVVCDAE
jgi:hypothetical protein